MKNCKYISTNAEGNILLPNIKKIFIPDPGNEICDADLSGADIMVVAADSGCKWLLDFFSKPQDKKVYAYIASEFFQRDISDKSSEYKMYKSIFHGCITGDHEVLTPNGWIRIDEYNELCELMVWNPLDGDAFFEIPIGMNRDFVSKDEPLIHIKGKSFDQLTTIDHKFLCRYKGKDMITQAQFLPESARLPYTGRYNSKVYISHNGTNVYCPKTSTGFFIVRRNGHMMITGNTNYLMGTEKLATTAGISYNLAKNLQEFYFNLNPEIPKWHKHIEKEIKSRGYLTNIFGRRMWFLDRNNPNLMNEAAAAIPQSTIGDVINRAWIVLKKLLPALHVSLQTHDSLTMQYSIGLGEEYRAKILEGMKVPLPYTPELIIPADIKWSRISYGDCTKGGDINT